MENVQSTSMVHKTKNHKHMTLAHQGGIQTGRWINTTVVPSQCPPFVMLENHNSYSVVLNLWGFSENDILVDVDNQHHEFGVYAGKNSREAKSAFFWVFGVPKDGELAGMKIRYKKGAVEVLVPKVRQIHAA